MIEDNSLGNKNLSLQMNSLACLFIEKPLSTAA